MKAKEITAEDRKRWKKNGYFPVVCRICDDVMLYPFPTYKPEMFIGYECQECKRIGTIFTLFISWLGGGY